MAKAQARPLYCGEEEGAAALLSQRPPRFIHCWGLPLALRPTERLVQSYATDTLAYGICVN